MGSPASLRSLTVAAAIAVAACSGESTGAVDTTTGATMSLVTTTSTIAAAPSSESSTIAPEPTGVPGLDDGDPWCAAWAQYSGSLQSIGVAAAFGDVSSADVAGLELLAAVSVTDAVRRIDASWPDELTGERDVAVDDLLGPYGRRAEKGVMALRDAGVTDDELVELGAVWMDALRARDTAEAVLVPTVRDELLDKVRAAALEFDAAVTPFAADPSLVVDSVETPATDAYLAAHCPDLANSGVGDAV